MWSDMVRMDGRYDIVIAYQCIDVDISTNTQEHSDISLVKQYYFEFSA